MARKAGQGKEEEESRARQQEEKPPVREEEKTPACDGRGHHVVEQDKVCGPGGKQTGLVLKEWLRGLQSNPQADGKER
ncbi:hypothetical protein STEG23_009858, partial [Scotinomys teguina]